MKRLKLLAALFAVSTGYHAGATVNSTDACLRDVEKALRINLGPTMNEIDFIQAATTSEAQSLASQLPEPYRRDAMNLIGSGAIAYSSRAGYADTLNEGIQFHLVLRTKDCRPLRILKLEENITLRR